MDNVVEFPRNHANGSLPATLEEAQNRIEGVRQYYIDELATTFTENLANQLMASGFPILDDEFRKDFAFLIETIRSLMCSSSGLYHPFQDVAENVMKDEEGDGVLTIADEVSVKFLEDEKSEDGSATEVSP